jgi:hypothetical protein
MRDSYNNRYTKFYEARCILPLFVSSGVFITFLPATLRLSFPALDLLRLVKVLTNHNPSVVLEVFLISWHSGTRFDSSVASCQMSLSYIHFTSVVLPEQSAVLCQCQGCIPRPPRDTHLTASCFIVFVIHWSSKSLYAQAQLTVPKSDYFPTFLFTILITNVLSLPYCMPYLVGWK